MEKSEFTSKVANAAKWSVITEIVAKLISPITTMILARLLTPGAFGVVASVTMVFSFADMLTDAGFQKYLVQHDYLDAKHKKDSTNVAFWTNLTISLLLWGIIIIYRNPLAVRVGNPGLGFVIVVACAQLPITSFSSIQMALYRRDFDFKTLFLIRVMTICVPFIVTIPLASLGWGYWSLIIGTLSGSLLNAVVLTIKSKWKPQLYYSFRLLKEMLSFSIWTLIEEISIWFTSWVDVFIIGTALSVGYLGLYKTSLTLVTAIFSLVTAATSPVLFSALSRLQNDHDAYNLMFFQMQRIVAYCVLPIGVGIYLYSNVATSILLGNQWAQASKIIGIWAFTSAIVIILGYYSSEVYRSKGMPRLSFLAQLLHLIFLVPTCMISLKYGFWVLVYARAFIRFQSIFVHLIIMKYIVNFPVGRMFTNITKPVLFTLIMGVVAWGLKLISFNIYWSIFSIIICIVIYVGLSWIGAKDDVKSIMAVFIKRKTEAVL